MTLSEPNAKKAATIQKISDGPLQRLFEAATVRTFMRATAVFAIAHSIFAIFPKLILNQIKTTYYMHFCIAV